MHNQNTTRRQGQGIALTLAPRLQPQRKQQRRIRPGDRVLIFDALVSQNIWVIVDDLLITEGRTRLRSGNMNLYFDSAFVIAHQKGGRR